MRMRLLTRGFPAVYVADETRLKYTSREGTHKGTSAPEERVEACSTSLAKQRQVREQT